MECFSLVVFVLSLSLFFLLFLSRWQRIWPQNEFSSAHSTGKNGQIVLLISARTTPIRKLYSIFIVINWMSMSNRSLHLQFDSFIASSLSWRDSTIHIYIFTVFSFISSYTTQCAVRQTVTHTRSRVYFLSSFRSSKECWKTKTSCVYNVGQIVCKLRETFLFLYRKTTENRNYSEHLFPPSHSCTRFYVRAIRCVWEKTFSTESKSFFWVYEENRYYDRESR